MGKRRIEVPASEKPVAEAWLGGQPRPRVASVAGCVVSRIDSLRATIERRRDEITGR